MANDNEAGTGSVQSRRELLKRLGVAGGALVWATPVVQTIATGIAGAQQVCADISHLDVIATVSDDTSGTRYGVQWDPKDGWTKHPTDPGHCIDGMSWTQPTSFSSWNSLPTPTFNAATGSYTVTFPSWAIIQAAYSKAGAGCQPAVNTSGNTWRFDKWCETTTTTSSTTTTTLATTTTAAPTTTTSTTTAGGGGGATGSPVPGKDISHMDFVLCRTGGKGNCNDRYGVQYTPGEGWDPHPGGPDSEHHCLATITWRTPPSTFSFDGFGDAVPLGGGAFRISLPADVKVNRAMSKCATVCRDATHLGGNTWRFDPC